MKQRKGKRTQKTYTYIMHVTETVENQITITSSRKLSYEQLEKHAEEARIEGTLDFIGVSNVAFALDGAKPGGASALARTEEGDDTEG